MQTLEQKLKILGWQGGTVWQANEATKAKYLKELQALKSWDEAQKVYDDIDHGFWVLMTAGHGYLIVPKDDENYSLACSIAQYGFKGKLAVYLEEDCEAGEFLNKINK